MTPGGQVGLTPLVPENLSTLTKTFMIQGINKSGRRSFFANPRISLFMFLLSVAVFLYYIIMKFVITDVYRSAVVGAIFELLWLPMLMLLVVIPIAGVLMLIKSYSNKGLAVGSILLIAAAIVVLVK